MGKLNCKKCFGAHYLDFCDWDCKFKLKVSSHPFHSIANCCTFKTSSSFFSSRLCLLSLITGVGILLYVSRYNSYCAPSLPFGSLEALDRLQIDHLPFLSSGFIVKDIGCSVLNLVPLNVSPFQPFNIIYNMSTGLSITLQIIRFRRWRLLGWWRRHCIFSQNLLLGCRSFEFAINSF
jgi:hypothetical protein